MEVVSKEKEFWLACEHHNLRRLAALVRQGLRINELRDINQNTPLHWLFESKWSSRQTLLVELLKYDIDLLAANKFGFAPLHLALKCAWPEDPRVEENKILLETLWNAYLQHPSLLRQILAQIDNAGRLPLHYAVRTGPEWVQRLIDAYSPLTMLDKNGLTPLHEAVKQYIHMAKYKRQYIDVVKQLLGQGVPVMAQDISNQTPLDYLFEQPPTPDTVKLAVVLLSHGATPSFHWESEKKAAWQNALPSLYRSDRLLLSSAGAMNEAEIFKAIQGGNVPELLPSPSILNTLRDSQGRSLLHVAIQAKKMASLDALLAIGCSPAACDKYGRSTLHWAVKLNQTEAVEKCLRDSPLIINLIDRGNHTALYYACRDEDPKLAIYLLEHGADPNFPDKEGLTPLHLAAQRGQKELISCLLASGARVNAIDKLGWQPLHCALKSTYTDIARLLVLHGADPTAINRDGQTPVDLVPSSSVTTTIRRFLNQLPDLAQVCKEQRAFRRLLKNHRGQLLVPPHYLTEHQQLRQRLHALSLPDVREEIIQSIWQQVATISPRLFAPYLPQLLAILGMNQSSDELAKRRKGQESSQHHLEAVEDYRQALPTSPIWNELRNGLQQLYQHDQQALASPSVVCARLGDRPALLRVVGMLPRQLLPAVTQVLRTPGSASTHGLHVVKALGGIHFKLNPEAPGVEYATDSFNNILMGQGSTPTELLKVIYPDKVAEWYLASKTVLGIGLDYILQHEPYLLEKLDIENFSALMILSLFTGPEDGKPDNYCVKLAVDSDEEVRAITLVGIDNDRSFAPAICKEKRSHFHFIQIKTVLYFLPHMKQSLAKEVLERILKLSPEQCILQWLNQLWQQNQAYNIFSQEGLLQKGEMDALKLPICFKPGTVNAVYQRLRQLQVYLRSHPDATHWELLEHVEPILQRYYFKLFEQYPNEPKKCIERLYFGAATVEKHLDMENNPELQTDLAAYSDEVEVFEERPQTLDEAAAEWIKYAVQCNLTEENRRSLYMALPSHLPFLRHLFLQDSRYLSPEELQHVLQGLPQLNEVTLNGQSMKVRELSAVLASFSYQVKIGNTCQLEVIDWTSLVTELGLRCWLQVSEQTLCLGQPPLRLFEAALTQHCYTPELLEFILYELGVDANACIADTPLAHLAVQHEAWDVLLALAKAGANLHALNKEHITVYQRLAQCDRESLICTLKEVELSGKEEEIASLSKEEKVKHSQIPGSMFYYPPSSSQAGRSSMVSETSSRKKKGLLY
jgi:ankyrin repeat protein